MAVTAEQPMVRKRRPWIVHTVWALVALGCLAGGVALGFRWCGQALAGLTSTNRQSASFARIRITLAAIESDDPVKLRHANAVLLYEAVDTLGYLPRYTECRPSDREQLAHAIAWLDSHPVGYGDMFKDLRKMAATFCDKPPPEVNIP
jgi:hypothetical protein